MMNALSNVMTVKEIACEFGIHIGTVYQAILFNALVEGIDCRKSGNTWLILRSAAERIWTYRKADVGVRRCAECGIFLPLDTRFFGVYPGRAKTVHFRRVCRQCTEAGMALKTA